MFHRGVPRFYAFDLLACNGEGFRSLPVTDRKQRIRTILPTRGERLLYVDHIEERGLELISCSCSVISLVMHFELGSHTAV
jgi:ATP-dependent DNA ligase